MYDHLGNSSTKGGRMIKKYFKS